MTIVGFMASTPSVADTDPLWSDRPARARWVARDLLIPEAYRLGDRVRLTALDMFRATVHRVRSDLARRVGGMHDAPAPDLFERLRAGHLSADDELAAEFVAQARQDWLERRLETIEPATALTGDAPAIASLAGAAALAEARTAAARHRPCVILPPRLERRLTWSVAAAMGTGASGRTISALSAAAAQPGAAALPRPEDAAMRFVAGPGAIGQSRGDLIFRALADRCLPLCAAALADGASLGYDAARELLLEPADPMLWIAVRRAGVPRSRAAILATVLGHGDTSWDPMDAADRIDRAYGGLDGDDLLEPLRAARQMTRAIDRS